MTIVCLLDENEKTEAIRRQLGGVTSARISAVIGERTERSYFDASQREINRRNIGGMVLHEHRN